MGGYGLGKVQPILGQAARAPGVAVDRYWPLVVLGAHLRL